MFNVSKHVNNKLCLLKIKPNILMKLFDRHVNLYAKVRLISWLVLERICNKCNFIMNLCIICFFFLNIHEGKSRIQKIINKLFEEKFYEKYICDNIS